MINRNLKIATAVASALGLGQLAHAATAVTITQFGSSAIAPIVEQVFTDNCVPGTLNEYRDAATQDSAGYTGGGKNFRTFTCTMQSTATTGAISGYAVTYYERLAGGSAYGINPVARSQSFPGQLSTSGCTAVSGALTGVNGFACPAGNTASAVPDIGISDVEPALFYAAGNPNLPSGLGTPLGSADQGKLTSAAFLQQVFGIAVSSDVGITNLTSGQVSQILAGYFTNYNQVGGANLAINICGRNPGSGTQASANAIFLGNPCAPFGGGAAFATGSTVYLGNSTGDVQTCLNKGTAGFASTGLIGPLGLADARTADTFKFVSIDGVTPSAANAATGAYKYAVESTVNYRTSGYSTEKNNFITALTGTLTAPGSIKGFNTSLKYAAVNALNGYTATNPYDPNNPVEWGSRGGSTCAPYLYTVP